MRITAGILMIMYGVKTIGTFVGFWIEQGFDGFFEYVVYGLVGGSIVIILAVFIITGGVFCLTRKYWKLCFASSLVLLLFMIITDLFGLFPVPVEYIPFWVRITSLPWGILPLIFVCLRKSEWQEVSA